MTDKVLIANRGEIAIRIAKAAHQLGYATAAVFSEADRHAPHVGACHEAVCIGPAPLAESYLKIEAVVAAARRVGADLVHPGYGFLSESAAFARACGEAGLVFIGPSPEAIAIMGDKARARTLMASVDVPVLRGVQGDEPGALLKGARELGFPLMIKAVAGGGGRGMRLVTREADLEAALADAASEAAHAFGNGQLLLERALTNARHVEVQICADAAGAVFHLFERDCSVQRRHQKVVEEAPAPGVDPDLRERLGRAAIKAAKAVQYQGVGTVEFLLDDQDHFYFLEMNTRLQVEHGVTEVVSGMDLVALQFQLARGQALPPRPCDSPTGWAMEARLYAEDPHSFLPQSGRITFWQPPEGEGLRVDHALRQGLDITPYYDPLLAKIIAVGATREQARRRLQRALSQTVLLGLKTNLPFLAAVLAEPRFREGRAHTDLAAQVKAEAPPVQLAAMAAALFHHRGAATQPPLWRNWYSANPPVLVYRLGGEGGIQDWQLKAKGSDCYGLQWENTRAEITVGPTEGAQQTLLLDGLQKTVAFAFVEDRLYLQDGVTAAVYDDLTLVAEAGADAGDERRLCAPMAGRLVALHAAVGQTVRRGQVLARLEAMKMEHRLESGADGTVATIHAEVGQQLAEQQLILALTEADQ